VTLIVFAIVWATLTAAVVWIVHAGLPRLAAWLESTSTWAEDLEAEYEARIYRDTETIASLQWRLNRALAELRDLCPPGVDAVIVNGRRVQTALDEIDEQMGQRRSA
jgi:hypothetical protein